jgi:putative NADH-flavin reductase
MLRIIGYILLALVALVASYVFWLSGSSHVPVNVLKPAAYTAPGGPIIVFGGSRATGLEIVRLLRERGEDVTVAVRASSDTSALQALGVRTVTADVLNAAEVSAALASAPYKAVISTIGTSRGDQANRPDYVGNRNIIDAAKAVGARRFLFITVIGAGESAETAPLPARRALAEVIKLKTQAEDHLKASGLDWTHRPRLDGPGVPRGGPAGLQLHLADRPGEDLGRCARRPGNDRPDLLGLRSSAQDALEDVQRLAPWQSDRRWLARAAARCTCPPRTRARSTRRGGCPATR